LDVHSWNGQLIYILRQLLTLGCSLLKWSVNLHSKTLNDLSYLHAHGLQISWWHNIRLFLHYENNSSVLKIEICRNACALFKTLVWFSNLPPGNAWNACFLTNLVKKYALMYMLAIDRILTKDFFDSTMSFQVSN
jgi:hypothetical protein